MVPSPCIHGLEMRPKIHCLVCFVRNEPMTAHREMASLLHALRDLRDRPGDPAVLEEVRCAEAIFGPAPLTQ